MMLYLLRHGETEFNRTGRLQGQQDSPLTARGRDQARAHGALLKTLIVDPAAWRVVASPLGRALDTARLACAELGLAEAAIETDPRLKEIAYGASPKARSRGSGTERAGDRVDRHRQCTFRTLRSEPSRPRGGARSRGGVKVPTGGEASLFPMVIIVLHQRDTRLAHCAMVTRPGHKRVTTRCNPPFTGDRVARKK